MKKEMVLIVSSLLQNSVENECNQIGFEVFGSEDEMIKVWSITGELHVTEFHQTRLISLINSISNVSCYLQYNIFNERVELIIF